MSEGIVTYTRDQISKCNIYGLRRIPDDDDKYHTLRKFVSEMNKTNLSNVVRKPQIPAYLKDRYGDFKSTSHVITRGNYGDQREVVRRKLYTPQNQTIADQINEEIRDLLSKLSESNKDKLLTELSKKEIPDECGQTLIDQIYLFAVDLSYLIPLYVEVILILKKNNVHLYDQLIAKIVMTAQNTMPVDEGGKRLRMGNISLLSEIYNREMNIIDGQTVSKIVGFLLKHAETVDYLVVLCELLKRVIKKMKQDSSIHLDEQMEILRKMAYDSQYEKRYRFMIQDVLEIYNEGEEEAGDGEE